MIMCVMIVVQEISSPESSSESKQSPDHAHEKPSSSTSVGAPPSHPPLNRAAPRADSAAPIIPHPHAATLPANLTQPQSAYTTELAPSVPTASKPQSGPADAPPGPSRQPSNPAQNGVHGKRVPAPPISARPTRSAPAALPPHKTGGVLQDSTEASQRVGPASQPMEGPSGGAGLMPPPPPRVGRGSGGSVSAVGQVSRFGRAAGNSGGREAAPEPARGGVAGRGNRPQVVKGGLARALCNKLAASRPPKGPTVSEVRLMPLIEKWDRQALQFAIGQVHLTCLSGHH
jgi:hypothetical protein